MPGEDEEVAFELEMPFVCVTSKGGPFDDEPFVAGFRVGQIYAMTYFHVPHLLQMVSPAEVEQIDLIAMKHGYRLETIPRTEEWTEISLTRMS